MNENITIKATDGVGEFSAYVSLPAQTPAPAVLVIQEIFGVNKNLRVICDNLAAQGYVAICPDLFWRQEPGIQLTDRTEAEWAKAFQLYQGFNIDKGIDDLKATLAFVRRHPACNGHVGTMGFCLGGKLAYLMATRSDTDCNVSYYGVGLDELLGEAKNIKKPLLLHIAGKDKFVPHAAQLKIMEGLGKAPGIEMHIYPEQDHAFTRIGGQHYDKAAADQAHGRTAAFFKKNLTK